MLTDIRSLDGWSEFVARLPADFDLVATARRCGAFERARGVRRAEDLLRLALIYGTTALSLRSTAAWASAQGLAVLSDVALLLRLQGCHGWLEELVSELLSRAVRPLAAPAALLSRRVRLIDASVLSGPGAGRGGWRLHADYDLAACRFIGFELIPTCDDKDPLRSPPARVG